jgi:prepilin-type processing-associated H-X9-DG protein
MTPEQRAKIFNAHNGKAAVVYADGHSEVLTEPFLQKNIEALLTVNGGEKVDFDDQPLASDAHRLHYRTVAAIKIIVSLIVLIAVLLWMIHRPLPKENTKEEEEIQRENTSDPQVQAMEGEITQPSDPLSQDGEGQVG